MSGLLARYAGLRRTWWVCIGTTVLFLALAVFGLYLRFTTADWPSPFQFGSLLMAVAMTSFAVCASVAAEIGARVAQDEDVEPSVRWIAIAISCWLIFLFLEIVEWVRLIYLVDFGRNTPFGQAHLSITGFHWIAVLGSVGWLTWTVVNVRARNPFSAALFTHCINLWWLIILGLMYFSNATLGGF